MIYGTTHSCSSFQMSRMRAIHRALTPSDDLVFSIEHPVFMAAVHLHWIEDEDGRKTWSVNGYSMEGERRTNWFAEGVLKQHRTLAITIDTLIDAGFTLSLIDKFAPTQDQIAEMPELADEMERPMMLMVSEQKN